MSSVPRLRSLVFSTLAVLISGCIAIPILAGEETVVFDSAIAEDEVRSKVSIGENELDVKARLGEPILNFGPRKIFVYQWGIRKGSVFWAIGGPGAAIAGVEPVVMSHLLFIAFDPDGNVLKTGTTTYKPFDSMAEQVREWLSSNDPAAQVVGPRSGESTRREPMLFIFRPSKSRCSFPTFDSNFFKPSVALDGIVVGDLQKGEYLAAEIGAGSHEIVIDPVPTYTFVGQEKSGFVQDLQKNKIPATIRISVEPDQTSYLETYLCTGMGKIKIYAEIRDAPSALQELRDLKPAW